jgi:hypothetical protein
MILHGVNGAPPQTQGTAVGQVVLSMKADGTSNGYVWDGATWLQSHGTLERAAHPALYEVIRDTFGPADDATFTLPDLRGVRPVT